jgi:hypothetical protein
MAPQLTTILIAQLSGMTLGLSISGAVYINTAEEGLSRAIPTVPKEQIDLLVAGASNGFVATLEPTLQRAAYEAIVASWQKTFIIVYVAAAASLVSAIFLKVSGVDLTPPLGIKC